MSASRSPAEAPDRAEPMEPLRSEMLVVRVSGTEFGLRVAHVREVVDVPPVTRLPLPRPGVRGVASLRGEILPVLDLGARLFGRDLERPGRLVVVDEPASGAHVGLLVDEVAGLLALSAEPGEPPAEVEASLPAGWVDAVVAPAPDRVVTLLNLAPVLALREPTDEERE